MDEVYHDDIILQDVTLLFRAQTTQSHATKCLIAKPATTLCVIFVY